MKIVQTDSCVIYLPNHSTTIYVGDVGALAEI